MLKNHDYMQVQFNITLFSLMFSISFKKIQVRENLIFKLVGHELEDIAVIDIKPWVMHAEVAEKFLSYESRVFIAGDAAHRFPPAGGFGMRKFLN